jgi:hypothetical protein
VKLSAIIQARVLAFVEMYDLDPKGRVFPPEMLQQISKYGNFAKAPQVAELDEQKGIEFQMGKIGDTVVDALKLYNTLLVLETHSNTTSSKLALENLLEWGKQQLGLRYEPGMIRHWAYVSILTFYSESNILALANNPAAKLATKVTGAVSEIWKQPLTFEARAMSISHDPMLLKNGIASFLISPRGDTPYTENKFYSEAPLPTDMHIKFLEEFEADVLAASK